MTNPTTIAFDVEELDEIIEAMDSLLEFEHCYAAEELKIIKRVHYKAKQQSKAILFPKEQYPEKWEK